MDEKGAMWRGGFSLVQRIQVELVTLSGILLPETPLSLSVR